MFRDFLDRHTGADLSTPILRCTLQEWMDFSKAVAPDLNEYAAFVLARNSQSNACDWLFYFS